MARINAALVLALDHRVPGNQRSILEYLKLGHMMLDLKCPTPRGIGHRVEVAANRDHAFLADPALNCQHRAVGIGRQRLQGREFLGESLVNHALRCGVDARVCNPGAPGFELGVQIVQIPERATEEEVLPDIPERALHFALRLGPIRLTGPRRAIVVAQQREKRHIVGNNTIRAFADHRRLHPVIENLLRRAAHGIERRNMAPHHGLQILTGAESAPEPTGMAEHHREQPDLADNAGFICELHSKLGKIHLRLLAGRRLEPPLELCLLGRPHLADKVLHRRIPALVATLPDLAHQALRRQVGKGEKALAKILLKRINNPVARRPRRINRRLKPARQIFPHSLPVEARLPRDRADTEPLSLQILDQNDLSQSYQLEASLLHFEARA